MLRREHRKCLKRLSSWNGGRILNGTVMKTIVAAVVAIAVLWWLDSQFFNGRYSGAATMVIQRTLSSILPR